ncbi:MAG: hypothetical protein Q7T81_09100 [Pseudolabrys sp.]|nr:hypothetical protein [Pseudolabrys sp.]
MAAKQFVDCDVQEVLDLCGGDPMAALRVALIANALLEGELDRLKAETLADTSPELCRPRLVS